MATNDFLPFAVGAGANVLSQSDYAAQTAIANGYSAGIAKSAALNKTWRQSSIMAAVLAQFIVAQTGQNAVDDGTTASLLANLTAAVKTASAGLRFTQTSQYTTGPLALAASQAGSFIDLAAAYSGAVTLPALSSIPDGGVFYIWSGASATVSVLCSGTDTIFVNGSSIASMTMNNGDTLVIGKSGPAGAWVAMWGSAQFPYSAVYAGLAPKPNTGSGVGKIQSIVGTAGTALTLPSGGTWAYFGLPFNTSGQVGTSTPTVVCGVAAGGSTIGAATAGFFWYGFAWRVQ